MRNVESSMAGVVLMERGRTVSVAAVAVEVTAESHFAIAAYAEALSVGMLHHTVGCNYLCVGACQPSNQRSGHQSNF